MENRLASSVAVPPWTATVIGDGYTEVDRDSEAWGYLAAVDLFLFDHPDIEPIDIETPLCDPAFKAAGTADLLCRNRGALWLVDYKSSASIDTASRYGDHMRRPITHLDDCNLTHYALQTNMYVGFYRDAYPNETIRRMIVQFKPDGTYDKFFPPDYATEADLLLANHLSRLAEWQ